MTITVKEFTDAPAHLRDRAVENVLARSLPAEGKSWPRPIAPVPARKAHRNAEVGRKALDAFGELVKKAPHVWASKHSDGEDGPMIRLCDALSIGAYDMGFEAGVAHANGHSEASKRERAEAVARRNGANGKREHPDPEGGA